MTRTISPLAGVVGALVVVEATSGVLQGYYSPLYSDMARHLDINDAHINWFEAAQLLLSAIVVPLLARLGDMIGHRKVLIGSLAVTAAASWGIAFAPIVLDVHRRVGDPGLLRGVAAHERVDHPHPGAPASQHRGVDAQAARASSRWRSRRARLAARCSRASWGWCSRTGCG